MGAAASYLIGGFDGTVITLLIFIVIDLVSGITVAAVFRRSPKSESGSLRSSVCFRGLCGKGMILMFVLIGRRLDLSLGTDYIRDGVCIAFASGELLSIIENAGIMGIPMPSVITKAVDLLGKENRKNNDERN
ncbi:MAG: phage holin family protein [Oscillospiraceae bacterium]|nr:phage holin family protein [Oscillospiraceae bacterium]